MNKCSRTNDDSPRKCNRISDNPRKVPYELIKRITNNFSEERVLGRGASGEVFKGVLEDGEEVAVKILRFMGNINDQQFENEFEILKRLEHPNIVQLVAFCDEAQEECIEYNGKLTICQRIHRALCLEYMPNGSLGKLLHGENLGKNWPICYTIIKGICEGLKYLQEGLEFPIFHLDLKPDNILLNRVMMPKISDFGLSRLIGEENTKKTLTPLGTIGYLPPEFINHQVISKEYDIYSLGVIVTKIMTGTAGYPVVAEMGAEEFVEHVQENWEKCLQEIPRYESLEVDCKQVKRCIEIARRCVENDRHKRPTIKDIVCQLDETEPQYAYLFMENDRHKRPTIKDSVSQLDEIETEYVRLCIANDIVSELDGIELEIKDNVSQLDEIETEYVYMANDIVSELDGIELEIKGLPKIDSVQSEDSLVWEQDWYPRFRRSASCSPTLSYGEARYGRSASCPPGWFYREGSPEWSYREARYGRSASCCSPEWSDVVEPQYRIAASFSPELSDATNSYPELSDAKARYRSSSEPSMAELILGNMAELILVGSSHNDPPSEICHPAHPEHKVKLMTDAGAAPFLCDGCKEPGYGVRYTCDCGGRGQSLDLHTRCALADDPLFDLDTLVHPLFGYGKQFELRFLHEPPPAAEGRRICDACGEATRGYVYHCSEKDVDLHPCCASLPDRIIQDGRAFDLHRRASRPCALCPENEGQRRWFWAYRCYGDGDAVDLHVACLKETARRSSEACHRNQDVGDGVVLNVDGMLENMFSSSIGFDKFGEIAGTVASFITALVFGHLIVKF